MADAFEATLARAEELGAQVEACHAAARRRTGSRAYYLIAPAEASSNLARFDGVRYGLRVDGDDGLRAMYKETRARGLRGRGQAAHHARHVCAVGGYYDAYYGRAQRVRTKIARGLPARSSASTSSSRRPAPRWLISWALIFGHFGLPALGLVGGGLGSTVTWLIMCGALVAIVARERRFRRFHVFGHLARFDGQRTLAMVRLGWPIGVTMALEMGVFALARSFMGWIGAPAVAAHAIALQIAAITFMVPLGLGQAATVRVGLALGGVTTRGSRAPAGPPG